MLRLLAPVWAVLAAASPAFAEEGRYGNLVYDLPPGWSAGSNEGGVQVFLSDRDDLCEFCYVYLSAGAPAQGTLAGFLDANATRFVDEEDRGDVRPLGPAEEVGLAGYPALIRMIQLSDTEVQMIVAIELPTRFELVGFEAYGYELADLQRAIGHLNETITPMFESLRFVSVEGDTVLGEPEPGDLDGLYWGTWTSFVPGLDGMMQMQVVHEVLAFWPDGRFYDGTPPGGLAALDPDALFAAGDTSFGNYTRKGDVVALRFADGRVEQVRVAKGTLERDGTTLIPVTAAADGTALDGTISWFSYTGFAMPGTGGISAGGETTFRPDGTYSGDSFGGAFGDFDGAGFATSSESATGGRYRVEDGLVIMTPRDGSPPTAELVIDTGDGLMIDEMFLE